MTSTDLLRPGAFRCSIRQSRFRPLFREVASHAHRSSRIPASALGGPIVGVAALPAQRGGRGLGNAPSQFQNKRLPVEPGFRVYIVSDMAGMGAAAEMKEAFPSAEVVTVKTALSGSGGAMMPFARVHAEIRAAAMKAVQRAKAGQLKLVTFSKPYHVAWCIRNTFAQPVYEVMAKPEGFVLKPDSAAGPRCFTCDTNKAEEIGTILNLVEWAALKP